MDVKEIERQLDDRDRRIADLKESLEKKDELFLATTEKLMAAEHKRLELETSLMSLATDKDLEDQPDAGGGQDDTFIASNCRAAKLDNENNDLRYKLMYISSAVADFNQKFNEAFANRSNDVTELREQLEKVYELVNAKPTPKIGHSEAGEKSSGNVQLQVKMELEHERRVRTQQALDEAERRYYVLQRECETKSKECQEYGQKIKDLKVKQDTKIRQATEENKRLEKLLQLKQSEIMDSEARAKELVMRAEEFEDMFNGQLEVVKKLQTDLTVAYNDKKVLVKEMEALSEMFDNMESKYINEAVRTNPDPDELAENALAADAEATGKDSTVLGESCFKEVKTKHGTRMVLSVSKTFMKLRDLILEKKTLEEQVEKMKAINNKLCSRVNLHEEKLFNVTDELNKTWTFVSTLKFQHKQLHTSEQVLRAELTEKRQLLAKLREELEYSRESWNIVKKKTADSEREWRALRDEFAARRRMFPPASSESGYSDQDIQTEDDEASNRSDESESPKQEEEEQLQQPELHPESQQPELHPESQQPELQSESHPESQLELQNESHQPELQQLEPESQQSESQPNLLQLESQQPELEPELQQLELPPEPENVEEASGFQEESYPLFIPSMSFMAQVPPDMLPPLFPAELCDKGSSIAAAENYQELYHKLIASTARSAALANQLAEMHQKMKESGLEEDDEEDVEPKTEEESNLGEESEMLASEIESIDQDGNESPTNDEEDDSDCELEDLGLSPEDIEAALARFNDDDSDATTSISSSRRTSLTSSPPPDSDDDEMLGEFASSTQLSNTASTSTIITASATTSGSIPVPPPPPTFSLLPPQATIRPAFINYANLDSLDDDSSADGSDDEDPGAESESATAVTRFLIKRLPKQLSKLRNDKVELEDRINDLEATISNQNQSMLEMERRVEVYKKEAETARKWTASLSLNIGKANNDTIKDADKQSDESSSEDSN